MCFNWLNTIMNEFDLAHLTVSMYCLLACALASILHVVCVCVCHLLLQQILISLPELIHKRWQFNSVCE